MNEQQPMPPVIQGEVVPPVIMKDHYIAMLRTRGSSGPWFAVSVMSSEVHDPVYVYKNARDGWPDYDVRLVCVQLPVIEEGTK